jgi:mannose-6-phosphate isomerase-like protein (cupin superfamily)
MESKQLPVEPDVVAPDGSNVRILLALAGGSMAHFELESGETAAAVRHRTVEEIWYFLSGYGEMWQRLDDDEGIVAVGAGTCITIPLGTEFQFRSTGPGPLAAVAVTMPPWPGPDEAVLVDGPWQPTVGLDAG